MEEERPMLPALTNNMRHRRDEPQAADSQQGSEDATPAHWPGNDAPAGQPADSKGSLWWQYKHLAPVPITLVAGVVLTTIMVPYFINPLIVNLSHQNFNPRYLGIPGFDTFLGFVVPFFETMTNTQKYGIIPLGYFVTTHLGWQMAGAIESSRVDRTRNVFVHFYSVVVLAALIIGSYVITPLFWIVAYLSFNKVKAASLNFDKDVRQKFIRQERVVAAAIVVIVGFFPFLAGLILGPKDSPAATQEPFYQAPKLILGHDARFVWNTALFFTTPLLWQLIWGPFGRAPAETAEVSKGDRIKGHRAAMNSLLIIGGGCMAWHMYALIAIFKDPAIVINLHRVLMHYAGDLHTILFIHVDEIVLWLGFLMIPLAQEGLKAAARFTVGTILVGPGAAVAFYFFLREAAYLDAVEKPNESPRERWYRFRELSLSNRWRWAVHQVQEPWQRTLSFNRRDARTD